MTERPDEGWVTIGTVGRPHGRDGAFIVDRASEHGERFAIDARLYVAREPARVVSSKRAGGRVVVQLSVPVSRGARLELPRAELPELDEGQYYVSDLVGLRVVTDEGAALGSIADVLPLPANDVIELDNGELLPLVRDCVLEVDVAGGRVVVARSFALGG